MVHWVNDAIKKINMKILLVEDHEDLAQSLRQSLRAECFEVDLAHDGEKGWYYCQTNAYDLIILDHSLPKKNGQTLCLDIREKGISTPIIFLSGNSETKSKIEALNSGADDYITKPFSFSELMARIRAVLRRPKKIESEVLKIDNVEVDTTLQTVTRGGKDINLTRKEYMLFEYMLKNKGKVLSRSDIMESVWDMNADPFSNTIETHMLNLRKKIESLPGKKIIHTLKGRGYKVDIHSD